MMTKKNVISIQDLTREQILEILNCAESAPEISTCLRGKMLASCFFEPSTRTRLSFEAAIKQLGGDAIGFSEAQSSSLRKKETLFDTIKVIGQYADLIVLRHPLDGAARLAAEATDKPVINAGDGSNQHPTQTLIDLFTIRETQKKLEGVHIAFVGDLRYGRAARSLIDAVSLFSMRLYFVAVPGMEPSIQICNDLKRRGALFSFHSKLEDIIPKLDIVYVTRIQEERIPHDTYLAAAPKFGVNAELLEKAKPNLKILHPLPRVHEIDRRVDDTPYAHYFPQARNGVAVRKALFMKIFNVRGGE